MVPIQIVGDSKNLCNAVNGLAGSIPTINATFLKVDKASGVKHKFVQDGFKPLRNYAGCASHQESVINKLRMVHIFNIVAKFDASDKVNSSHMIQGPTEGFRYEDKEVRRERASLSEAMR